MSWAARLLALAAATVGVACSDEDLNPEPAATSGTPTSGGSGGGAACAPGTLDVGGECRPAGLPPDLPAPGPARDPEAGVPPEACAAGFDPDGERGCVPLLPVAPCPDGTMAIPGEATCRSVAACAPGTWGDIPTDATTQHVDASYAGADSDGTAAKPWTKIQDAVDAAAAGAIVAVAAGTYLESVDVLDQPVVVWGRCPQLVVVDAGNQTGFSFQNASGAALRSIAVKGDIGVVAVNADLAIDRVRVFGAPYAAIIIEASLATVTDSLVEDSAGAGVVFVDSTGEVRDSVIREIKPHADGAVGRGIDVASFVDGGPGSDVAVDGTVVEQVYDIGIAAFGSSLNVSRTVVRDVLASISSGYGTGCVFARATGTGEPSTGTVRTSVISDVLGAGISAQGSTAEVEHTVVQDCRTTVDWSHGWGVGAQPGVGSVLPAAAVVRASTIRRCREYAVRVRDSTLELYRVLIADTSPNDLGAYGWGVYGETSKRTGATRAEIRIEQTRIERAHHAGAGAFGATLVIEDTVILDIGPDAMTKVGMGVFVGPAAGNDERPELVVRRSVVQDVALAGIVVSGGDATVESSVVRDVRDEPGAEGTSAGVFVAADSLAGGAPTTLTLSASLIEECSNMGVIAIGADADIETTTIRSTNPVGGAMGRGIHVGSSDDVRGRLVLSWSRIEQVHDAGVFALASDAEIIGTIVRDVSADPAMLRGYGIVAAAEMPGDPASVVTVRGCVVESGVGPLLAAHRSELTVESTVARDAVPLPDGKFGRCVNAQFGSTLTLRDSLLHGCHETGALLLDSAGTIDNTTVRDVAPRASDGLMGDAIAFVSQEQRASGSVRNSVARGATRVGLFVYASDVEVSGTSFECNPIHLSSEATAKWPDDLQDGGGNSCGCDGASITCAVAHATLAPPEPLP